MDYNGGLCPNSPDHHSLLLSYPLDCLCRFSSNFLCFSVFACYFRQGTNVLPSLCLSVSLSVYCMYVCSGAYPGFYIVGTEAARVHFFSKKLTTFLVVW